MDQNICHELKESVKTNSENTDPEEIVRKLKEILNYLQNPKLSSKK